MALAELKDKQAVESLVEALNDENKYVREEAANALGEIGDTSALDALYKALGRPEHISFWLCFTVSPSTMWRSPKGFAKGRASKRYSIGRRKKAHSINKEFRRPAKPYSHTFLMRTAPSSSLDWNKLSHNSR